MRHLVLFTLGAVGLALCGLPTPSQAADRAIKDRNSQRRANANAEAAEAGYSDPNAIPKKAPAAGTTQNNTAAPGRTSTNPGTTRTGTPANEQNSGGTK